MANFGQKSAFFSLNCREKSQGRPIWLPHAQGVSLPSFIDLAWIEAFSWKSEIAENTKYFTRLFSFTFLKFLKFQVLNLAETCQGHALVSGHDGGTILRHNWPSQSL